MDTGGQGATAVADPSTTDLSVGAFIRLLRERAGLSARQLSHLSGLSPAYVNKVERGDVEPSFRAFSKIAVKLGMTQREVFLLVCQESDRT